MRDSKPFGLLAAAALLVAGSPLVHTERRATRREVEKPRRHSQPFVKWRDMVNTPEIQAWSRAVDERKAAKRAAKVRGE